MPTDTFFRLPEEKRARILEGAWSEFTAVPYAEASINRIVQTSRIPRGSFYQYFEDKNDLFLTLIDEIRDQFLDLFHDTLERSGGDLFAMPLALLDAMVAPSGCITPAFSRASPARDAVSFVACCEGCLPAAREKRSSSIGQMSGNNGYLLSLMTEQGVLECS